MAVLFDGLSLAFAYPTDKLYDDLKSGVFARNLQPGVTLIPDADSLGGRFESLQRAARSGGAGSARELESLYISLFEANRQQAPLHLYGYLYDARGESRMQAMQRLQKLYRDFDLELQPGAGTESPDHLTVQLEFMAYLLRLQRQAQQDNRTELLDDIGNGIRSLRAELRWISVLAERLESRTEARGFYAPLARFLDTLLALTAP